MLTNHKLSDIFIEGFLIKNSLGKKGIKNQSETNAKDQK